MSTAFSISGSQLSFVFKFDVDMEKESEKETENASSSRMAVDSSRSLSRKSKKKKNVCTCKGFASPEKSVDEKVEKRKSGGGKGLSAWFREKEMWENYIRQQRKDLRRTKHVIDDDAPRLNIPYVYDMDILKSVWKFLEGAFQSNYNVLKTLHDVNMRPGKTDTFTFNYSNVWSTNYSVRKKETKSIEKQNEMILKMLKRTLPRITTAKQHAKDYKRHEALLESFSQFPLWWKVKEQQAGVEIGPPIRYIKQHITEKSVKYPDKRPRVFLEVAIKNVGIVGKMIVMLYSDYVPMTCKNFLAFCNPKARLTYKGNFFYFIFENFYCQTGDVVENMGFGGTSIYGPYFGNENFTLKHSERGILTMFSKIPNRNTSQFLITFRQLESLDGRNVVFGKVIKGLHVLESIEGVGSKKTGRPKVGIYISDCDEI